MSVEARMNADQAADAAAREAADAARRDASARDQYTREQAAETARINAERLSQNVMAVAALLLVLGALAVGGGGLLESRGKRTQAIWAASVGGVLMLAAIVTFLLRPSGQPVLPQGFDVPKATPTPVAASGSTPLGKMVCKFQPDRSRVTVSAGNDVSLDWGQDGCMNARTQYAEDNGKWTRVLVPGDEQNVSVIEFDPATRTYISYRYFLSAPQMDNARKLRSQATVKACTSNINDRNKLMAQQAAVRAALPASYSEKLVYTCSSAPASAP